MPDTTTKPLLSLGALARRVDVPMVRLSRLVRSGDLVPDFTAGPAKLFLPDRIKEVLARLQSATTHA